MGHLPEASGTELLVTVLGEIVLPTSQNSAWVSSLLTILAELGITERNARQAIARQASKDLLRVERIGRVSRCHLTKKSKDFLVAGAQRIYGFAELERDWDERWLVVMCSVPESERAKRARLRTRLGFEGFGFLNPTTAICAHTDRESAANQVLQDLGLGETAVVMKATAGFLSPDDDLIVRTWDLENLGESYELFNSRFVKRTPKTDAQRTAALIELVHAWRQFPFIDPEIPARLLPKKWQGHAAKEMFDSKRTQWAPGANAWFQALEHAGR
jgi:phenylacetic acid degradation operon negative regulatory protein